MKLLPSETCLTGKWLIENGALIADVTCERIDFLVKNQLHKLGQDASGWDTLFVDLSDQRFWELIYIESSMHGGGAPQLRCLSADEANKKYEQVSSKK